MTQLNLLSLPAAARPYFKRSLRTARRKSRLCPDSWTAYKWADKPGDKMSVAARRFWRIPQKGKWPAAPLVHEVRKGIRPWQRAVCRRIKRNLRDLTASKRTPPTHQEVRLVMQGWPEWQT